MPVLHPTFQNVFVFDHPLIQEKLTRARERDISHQAFRRLLNEIAGLMTFEISRELQTRTIEIETPLEQTTGVRLDQPITLVPILRAGIGMTDGILALMPEARVGHLGLYRDEQTLQPVSYYAKLPVDIASGRSLLIDPMLATGGSATFAVDYLKKAGCRDIRIVCLVAAPEGLQKLHASHPEVNIYTAAVDDGLDERGYIRPGLGDAGDRIFGTL